MMTLLGMLCGVLLLVCLVLADQIRCMRAERIARLKTIEDMRQSRQKAWDGYYVQRDYARYAASRLQQVRERVEA